MTYCVRCATPLVRAIAAGRERPVCPACGYIVYRNPVPVSLVGATCHDKLLLIRRKEEPLSGFWAPPSGYVEYDESTEEAAVRETWEETGYEVALDGLLDVYSRPNLGILFVAYAGHVIGGKPMPGDDVEAVGLFALTELPAQPPCHRGTLLDVWFLEVINSMIHKIQDGGS